MRKTTNSGSALHILLLAIVLFAAVSAVITQSGKGGSDILRPEKAKLYAGEIISHANRVKQAVRRVMLVNGCSDTQVSFERSPFDGSDTNYVNASAPSDFSCHVYHPAGGGVNYSEPSDSWRNTGAYNYWTATSYNCVTGIGLDSASCSAEEKDLVYTVLGIKKEICEAIVNQISGEDTIPSQGYGQDNFDGAYTSGLRTPITTGHKAYCFEDNDGGSAGLYYFYTVLIQR